MYMAAQAERKARLAKEGRKLRSNAMPNEPTEEDDVDDSEEEGRRPLTTDGEGPSEYEPDDDESDLPPSPTVSKQSQVPKQAQVQEYGGFENVDIIHIDIPMQYPNTEPFETIDFNFLDSPGHQTIEAPTFSPVLVHMNPMELLEGDNIRVLREKLEIESMAGGVTLSIDGKVTKETCNAILCLLPSGMHVTGFDKEGVPHWNTLDKSRMTQILALAQSLLDDDGILVIVTSKDAMPDLLQSTPAYNLRVSDTVGLFCKHPYAIVEDCELHALEILILERATRLTTVPRWKKDIYLDTKCGPSSWYRNSNGEPLKGGMQRSPDFYEMLLKTYTNKGDVVLQLYAEVGMLAEKAREQERHLVIVDHNEVFAELPDIFLSPIKSVKSARVAQTYSEISFPPPPAVFVSPRVDAHKDSSSLQRNQCANGVEEAQTTSENGSAAAQKEGKRVLLSSSQRVQKLRNIRKSQKNQSFPSPCSSPSKLVEEYLAEPVDEDLSTEEDLEMLPNSSTCETRATTGDTNSLCVDGMEFRKQEDLVLKALPKLLDRNASYMGRVGLTEKRCTQDAQGSKSCGAISLLKHVAHQSGDINNEAILDFHQEAADLEFLMSEDVDESHHHPAGMGNWHNVTSSNLSELSVEQVEGYIASLRGIVNEEQEMMAGFSTQLSTEVIADESLMIDNLEADPEAQGSQGGAVTCKVTVPQQRGVRRRCLDFEVSEGHMQNETSFLSLKPVPSTSGTKCQGAPCGAESNRSLLVLKKRVSATLGATNNDSAQGIDACTGCCSRKDGTASIKMTRATSINIKLSRCSSFKDGDSRLPCAKTSPVPAGMPSGIGLHLNSLTSSMPCTQMREIDGSGGPVTSLKPGNTLSGGMLASKLQGSPAESTEKCLIPLNPGKRAYAGSTAESRQGLVALMPETRMDDCEVQSECSDQDIDSSKTAICVQSASLGNTLVHDVVPLNILNKRPSPLGRKRVLLQDKHYQGELEGGGSQSPYSPKKRRRWSSIAEKSGDGCKRCNCKKSKCLKLYCECFAAGVYCVDSCTCQGCFNKPEFEEMVMDTRQQIESRNPLAFAPKIIRASESSPTKRQEDSRDTPASARHKRGCNCKKSHCLKKYCECFQAGVGCSDGCRCESCKNVHGRKEGSQDSDENELQVEAVVNKELAEEHIGTSEFCTELIHGSHHQNHELSPITPAFQHGGQHRPTTKSSTAIKRRGSLEVLRSPSFSLASVKPCRSPSKLPRSPSRLLRSCKGAQNSPPMTSTGISLPTSGSSPVSTPRILRIGRFSPRWDGLDEICTLTPGIQAPLRPTPASASVLDRADLSPSVNEQNCNEISSTGNGLVRHKF